MALTNSSVSSPGTEGSLSDSGISDSGSEQDLSEREKRLAALKRLARNLEGVLAPGSVVLTNMAKVMNSLFAFSSAIFSASSALFSVFVLHSFQNTCFCFFWAREAVQHIQDRILIVEFIS